MSCYILIGGASRRMGEAKDALKIANESFLSRTVRIASAVFDRVVTVDRPSGPTPLGDGILEEAHAESGPIFGIAAALRDSDREKVWILAVDYPALTSEILRFLAVDFSQSDCALLVPAWDGKLQMLCAGYSRQLSGAVAGRIGEGQYRLRDLADPATTRVVPEALLRSRFGGEPLMNVNDRKDYEKARGVYASG